MRCSGEDRCWWGGGGDQVMAGRESVGTNESVCEIRVHVKQTSTGGSLSLGESVRTAESKPTALPECTGLNQ